jgi:hypothetical protein
MLKLSGEGSGAFADRHPEGRVKPRIGEEAYTNKPKYMICTNCYKSRKVSMLQFSGQDALGKHYKCPECKTEIVDSREPSGNLPFGFTP